MSAFVSVAFANDRNRFGAGGTTLTRNKSTYIKLFVNKYGFDREIFPKIIMFRNGYSIYGVR